MHKILKIMLVLTILSTVVLFIITNGFDEYDNIANDKNFDPAIRLQRYYIAQSEAAKNKGRDYDQVQSSSSIKTETWTFPFFNSIHTRYNDKDFDINLPLSVDGKASFFPLFRLEQLIRDYENLMVSQIHSDSESTSPHNGIMGKMKNSTDREELGRATWRLLHTMAVSFHLVVGVFIY